MKRFIFVIVSMLLLMGVSVVFAADGVAKTNVWQTITGVLAFITTGAGAWIFKNMKIVKELREAIAALMQAIITIEIFAKKTPELLKEDPNFINMMKNLDNATEEIADVLCHIEPMKKYAAVLRKAIQEASYTSSTEPAKAAIWGAFEDMKISNSFKSALAKLSK